MEKRTVIGEDDLHNSRFQLWPYGWVASTNEAHPLLTKGALSLFADSLLSHTAIYDLFSSKVLTNCKGARVSETLGSLRPRDLPSREGELVIISGRLYPGSSEEVSFWYQRRAEFMGFIQSHSVQFSVATYHSESLPEWIPVSALSTVFPASIDYIGVGLEFFKTNFISTMIGFAPSVCGSLIVDADASTISLWREEEGLKSQSDAPLEQFSLAREIVRLCAGQ